MMDFEALANALRFLSVDAVEKAGSGHPGMPLGMADVATVLFQKHLRFNPQDPSWLNRDRFVLSAGHGSMLLYSALHLAGYPQLTLEEIQNFRQLHSRTPGHPEYGHTQGVETTTGPLGQGLATAVGLALGESLLRARVGSNLINHHIYVIASDGDLIEGISQEAISLAGHLKLHKLIVLFDDNGISIDGPTSLATSEDQLKRFEASGWNTRAIDGHSPVAIDQALAWAKTSHKPVLIACKTTIGKGAPTKAGKSSSHGSPLGGEEMQGLRANLNWPHAPFHIPAPIKHAWEGFAARCQHDYTTWQSHFAAASPLALQQLHKPLSGGFEAPLATLKKAWHEAPPAKATRQLSQAVIEAFSDHEPKVIGGSADLTGSNNTQSPSQKAAHAGDFAGQYIHYGVREHGMAACMNGLALYGFVPYGGTFLTFSDYLKPALRLSALMGQGVIYVFTHDSIALGEDGPTHQPIEHLAALRAIPHVNVLRPCDGIEVIEAWEYALNNRHAPTVIVLTRQNILPITRPYVAANQSAQGAYVIHPGGGAPQATLIATGSEVGLAYQAQQELQAIGIAVRIVSMPCMELFIKQPATYQQEVLGDAPRIIIEAACDFGWHRFMRPQDAFIGIHGFGASAPANVLYKHFNITTGAIMAAVNERI
jgi:transketolase